MSVSSISPNNIPVNVPQAKTDGTSANQAPQTAQSPVSAPQTDTVNISSQAQQMLSQNVAPDGDSASVEAAESGALKRAEKMNNGFAPKTVTPGFSAIA